MPLRSFSNIGQSIADNGKFHYQYLFKPTVPAHVTAGNFIDLNQSAGQPKYNPFAGSELTATALFGAGNSGIYPGNFISGSTKHLLRWSIENLTVSAGSTDFVYLNDYLMFYPLIDCDNTDQQDMINVEVLPRYSDGQGVRIVLIASAPMALTAPVTISYTNSLGVSGRTVTANVIPAPSIGVCATVGGGTTGTQAQANPFWPLANGDAGVRSIESITFSSGAGGFIVACLVKPLATLYTLEDNIMVEKSFGFENQNLPEIKENAYLNLLIQRASTANGNYRGEFIFINS